MLDGLDEAPVGFRLPLVQAVERVSVALPQHRFTMTSRPLPELSELLAPWRVLDLLCDARWRDLFLEVNGIEPQRFWSQLASAGAAVQSLLNVPFFLRGAVELIEAGVAIHDAMQVALGLLDRTIAADDQLETLGGATRHWLARVAISQQLRGEVTTGHDLLVALAADEGMGDATILADRLAGRSLLAASADRWAFFHRLFGEALAADTLLAEDPQVWLDAIAPAAQSFSAVSSTGGLRLRWS